MKTVSIEAEIDDAVLRLGFAEGIFRKCSSETARSVIETAMRVFVNGNPRVWWLDLKHRPAKVTHYPESDGYAHLNEFLPSGTDSCWFVPETGTDPIPVYDVKAFSIVRVLEECYAFEYNVVSKNYDWLVIENDHNVLMRAADTLRV